MVSSCQGGELSAAWSCKLEVVHKVLLAMTWPLKQDIAPLAFENSRSFFVYFFCRFCRAGRGAFWGFRLNAERLTRVGTTQCGPRREIRTGEWTVMVRGRNDDLRWDRYFARAYREAGTLLLVDTRHPVMFYQSSHLTSSSTIILMPTECLDESLEFE